MIKDRKETAKAEKNKEPEIAFYVQAAGSEYKIDEITASCLKDCENRTGTEANEMEVYINLDEKAAYYVADGTSSAEFKVAL